MADPSWKTGMKVDPCALTSYGVYSETYGLGEEANIANLYASLGMLEDAPSLVSAAVALFMAMYRRRRDS